MSRRIRKYIGSHLSGHDVTVTPVGERAAAPHTEIMPVRLHHIVIDAHDLPGLPRFWTRALGWEVLSEREREIVIGAGDDDPVGICFMPVTDGKTVKNRVHLDLTTSAADRDAAATVPFIWLAG